MWEFTLKKESPRIQKISWSEQQQTLSYQQVLDYWQNSAAFRTFFNGVLAGLEFEAYYWEVPPITETGLDQPFECVVVESEPLKRIIPDEGAFQDYFQGSESVVSFWNLGKDAKLVVPCPEASTAHYPHLAQFVRSDLASQQDQFWQRVGVEYAQAIGEAPRWLSTAGLGVSWLHLRIDSRPKYYRYGPYKAFPFEFTK